MIHRELPKPWPRRISDARCGVSVPPPADYRPHPVTEALIFTCGEPAVELCLTVPSEYKTMIETSLCARHLDQFVRQGKVIRNPRKHPLTVCLPEFGMHANPHRRCILR